jgi:hypothetical protein
MNSKINDTALDLGVFALDNEIENGASLNALRCADWDTSATWERVNATRLAAAS